ncbi:MAG: helix-turn-helix domain-containing protein [bacterium]|nr:helix-turn-helix domain-containing protein [bacterium]
MADEFYSFDEALDELRLKEEELKRLVSEGEIRAFRKGDTMKLRKSDVENLRAELSGGEVVDLGDATEELVFEDDAGLDDEAGMATQEIADVDTLIEDDVEDVGELELEDDDDDMPVAAARPVRRQGAADAQEDEEEGMGLRVAMIATAAILVITMPIIMSITTGNATDIAKSIAGIFGAKFPVN